MRIINQRTDVVPIDSVRPHERNVNQGDLGAIAESLGHHGFYGTIVAQESSGRVLAGNHRLIAMRQAGAKEIPVTFVDVDDDAALRILLVDNASTRAGYSDSNALAALLQELASAPAALAGTGYDGDALDELLADLAANGLAPEGALAPDGAARRPTLRDRFVVPPFSVLDARQGYWQERKRQWLALGIQSELGRGEGIVPNGTSRPPDHDGARRRHGAAPGGAPRLGSDGHTVRGDGTGRPLANGKDNGLLGESEQARSHYKGTRPAHGPTVTQAPDGTQAYRPSNRGPASSPARSNGQDLMRGEHELGASVRGHALPAKRDGELVIDAYRGRTGSHSEATSQSGTSIFDPVLCEVAYRWFCPPGGTVLDPFAGGSVRGIVAAKLGRPYVGVDLRTEQIGANEEQAATLLAPDEPAPRWLVGDSRTLEALCPVPDVQADLIFTCPPYYDLEVYGDDPADLSCAADYGHFIAALRDIIRLSLARLRDDRFACIVVGDIRDEAGYYRNFVSDTIDAFQSAGARLYNEAILVTAVGSLPIRVGKQFSGGRKLGKTHQNVLCFCKGDARRAVEACGPVDVEVPAVEQEQPEDSAALLAAAGSPGG